MIDFFLTIHYDKGGIEMTIYSHYEVKKQMKVFISWSGARSKKVALLFRDWLPTVIQALEPFVSSEDIEKGARWNTDIAQELKDSTFGLICVTKDNLASPWLNFEAGALSKLIDNSYVAPLLFDVKPSDLKGSPISQFQATSFSQEDMKRLVETLNIAAGNCLTPVRLNKAFELCYPDLEKSIAELKATPIDNDVEEPDLGTSANLDSNILEELLEMSRNTQRLLGNTDSKLYSNIEQVQKKIDEIISNAERPSDFEVRRPSRMYRTRFMDDILYSAHSGGESESLFPYNVLMLLSMFKRDTPWIYDIGRDVLHTLESNVSIKTKMNAISKYRNVVEYTCNHPATRDLIGSRKEVQHILFDIPRILENEVERKSLIDES